MTPLLLAFCANGRRAGKNTAAGFVELWCEAHNFSYEEKAFAFIGKEIIAKSLGLEDHDGKPDIKAVDSLKLSGALSIEGPRRKFADHVIGEAHVDPESDTENYGVVSVRDYIINIMEGFREKWGESFWTDYILPEDWAPQADVTVLTDLRFNPEAERVYSLHGKIVEIQRKSAQTGASENALTIKPSRTIQNDWDLPQLRKSIFEMMGHLKTEILDS